MILRYCFKNPEIEEACLTCMRNMGECQYAHAVLLVSQKNYERITKEHVALFCHALNVGIVVYFSL